MARIIEGVLVFPSHHSSVGEYRSRVVVGDLIEIEMTKNKTTLSPNPTNSATASLNAEQEDFIQEEDEDDEDDSVQFITSVPVDSTGDDRPLVDVDVVIHPRDKYWAVYVAFYFLGLTTLLPWNFFVNADKYWMYKFRDVSNGTTENDDNSTISFTSHDPSELSSPHGKTPFQASFTSYLAIAANVPSTLFFILNIFLAKWVSAKVRMISSLLVTLVFFISQTVLVEVNTDSWQETFFIITMITVVLMNAFCTLFQCGLLGIIGKFPHSYTTATMSGQALGGIFAAVANIISIFLAADELKSGFIYFILGSTSLLISFLIVILLPKFIFFKFHSGEKGIYRWVENYPPEALIRPETVKANSWVVLRKVWVPTVSSIMIMFVTLSAFPTLIVLVVSDTAPSVWNDKYFVPVVSFLVFASGDYIGRIASGATQWPRKDSYWTLALSIIRLLIIPLLMSCNLHPREHLPVLFGTDLEFGLINYLFGFSNGYLTNICFMNAPQLVHKDEQEEANGIVTMGIGIGLSMGVTLSYFILKAL